MHKHGKRTAAITALIAGAAMLAPSAFAAPAANDETTLKQAVAAAVKAGVTTNQDPTLMVKDQKTINADYATQITALTKIAAQATVDTDAYNQALKTINAINSQADAYKKQYPAATINTKDLGPATAADWQTQAKRIQDGNDANASAYATNKRNVDSQNAKTKAAEDQLKNSSIGKDDANHIYVTGSYNKGATGMGYFRNIVANYVQQANDDTVLLTESGFKPGSSSFTDITGFTGDSTDVRSAGLLEDRYPDITGTMAGIHVLKGVKPGSAFTVSNAGADDKGNLYDARILVSGTAPMPGKTPELLVGYDTQGRTGSDGYHGISFRVVNTGSVSLKIQFMKHGTSTPVKVFQSFIVADVDGYQSSKLSFDGNSLNSVNPDGSRLTRKGDTYTYDAHRYVNGFDSVPEGSYMAVGVIGAGKTMNYTHTESALRENVEYYFGLFGSGAQVAARKFAYLPAPTLNLVKLATPAKPQPLRISWHLEKPLNPVKDVIQSGRSVNGQSVKLGSAFQYKLSSTRLAVNRAPANLWTLKDQMDVKHDRFDGKVTITAATDLYKAGKVAVAKGSVLDTLTFKDGKASGTYFTGTYDADSGILSLAANSVMLGLANGDPARQAGFDATVDATRISVSQRVPNMVTEQYGQNKASSDADSNTVVTHTQEHPGLSVVKYDVKSGVKAGDRNDPKDALTVDGDGVEIGIRVTNTGDVELDDVTVADQTIHGSGTVTGIKAEAGFNGVLKPGQTVLFTGVLTGVKAGTTHEDRATVKGVTKFNRTPVTGGDVWNGRREAKPVPVNPVQPAESSPLAQTGVAVTSLLVAAVAAALAGVGVAVAVRRSRAAAERLR